MEMAKFASLLLLALLAFSMVAEMAVAEGHNERALRGYRGPGSLKTYQCGGQCNRRCGKTQYRKPCLVYCNKCCLKCLCVPPGFYGNKQVCGACYNNWKTKRGGPKCP